MDERGVVRNRGVVARLALEHFQTVCGIVCNLWMHHCHTHSLSNETLASCKQCCTIYISWVTNSSNSCEAAATSMPGCSKDHWICCFIWTAFTSLLDLPLLGQECLAIVAGNAPLLQRLFPPRLPGFFSVDKSLSSGNVHVHHLCLSSNVTGRLSWRRFGTGRLQPI
jgi:hypothetical protein